MKFALWSSRVEGTVHKDWADSSVPIASSSQAYLWDSNSTQYYIPHI